MLYRYASRASFSCLILAMASNLSDIDTDKDRMLSTIHGWKPDWNRVELFFEYICDILFLYASKFGGPFSPKYLDRIVFRDLQIGFG